MVNSKIVTGEFESGSIEEEGSCSKIYGDKANKMIVTSIQVVVSESFLVCRQDILKRVHSLTPHEFKQ